MTSADIYSLLLKTNPSDYSTDGFVFEELIYSVGVIPVIFLNIFEK